MKKENKVSEMSPWVTFEFPWGSAVKHAKGGWEKIFLKPDAQEIDVTRVPVFLSDEGIEFLQKEDEYDL